MPFFWKQKRTFHAFFFRKGVEEEVLRCEGVDSNLLTPAGVTQVLRCLREAATGRNAARVED